MKFPYPIRRRGYVTFPPHPPCTLAWNRGYSVMYYALAKRLLRSASFFRDRDNGSHFSETWISLCRDSSTINVPEREFPV